MEADVFVRGVVPVEQVRGESECQHCPREECAGVGGRPDTDDEDECDEPCEAYEWAPGRISVFVPGHAGDVVGLFDVGDVGESCVGESCLDDVLKHAVGGSQRLCWWDVLRVSR